MVGSLYSRNDLVVSNRTHAIRGLLRAMVALALAVWCLGGKAAPFASTRSMSAVQVPSGAPIPMGSIYHIARDGDDRNLGTLDQPWRTLQHAADTMRPGDIVYVHAGTYTESVWLTRSGTADAPISFTNYPGEAVVLDGKGVLDAAFQTTFAEPDPHVSAITIAGFTIENYRSFGIVGWSINNRFTLRNLIVRANGGAGIRLSNSDSSRIYNVLLQNNEGGFDCTPILPGTEQDPGCTHLHLADVQAIDNGTQGDTGTDAFAVERGADILVERCIASGGVGDGFDFKSNRTTLRQVIAYNTRNNIKLWGTESILINALAYDAKADANLVLVAGGSYTITNITLANVAATAYLVVAGDTSGSGPTPVHITNSIFYNDNPANEGTLLYFGPSIELISISRNLFYNPYRTDDVICADFAPYNGECFSSSDINAGIWPYPSNRYTNPQFIDAGAKNFRLTSDSPALDAGDPATAPPQDLENRPRASQPDLGAYEYDRRRRILIPLINRSQRSAQNADLQPIPLRGSGS